MSYLILEHENPPTYPPLIDNKPYSLEFPSIDFELIASLKHDDKEFSSDNTNSFRLLDVALKGLNIQSSLSSFCRKNNGRGAWLAFILQHGGTEKWTELIKKAGNLWRLMTYKGVWKYLLSQHCDKHQERYISIKEAS